MCSLVVMSFAMEFSPARSTPGRVKGNVRGERVVNCKEGKRIMQGKVG